MRTPDNFLSVESHDDLVAVLGQHGISTEAWGKDGKRTTDDLYREIQEGESALYLDGDVLRKFGRSIKMDVFYDDPEGNRYKLVEFAQYDPRTNTLKQRGTRYTLGEKIKGLDEDPDTAAKRGLAEELKIHTTLGMWATGNTVWDPTDDYDYPGLTIVNDTSYYAAELRREDYSPQGYVEEGRKTTYFVWQRIEAPAEAQPQSVAQIAWPLRFLKAARRILSFSNR